ncbi:hypothetical protein KY290_022275 [Solanum tuberosum]|uniref:Uncharacterized protein n=1 Tax=Solanum tuberosum TaxID=4113 RepID=A0ABQ7V5X9_SOLTU|nr:hypothetical protein KY289_021404 [Solanum tuberosum]KAH0758782.1 hypothetical protein KY290_022275 [Solanum tuberosum]
MVVAYIMLIVPQISDAMESPCPSGSVPLPLRRVVEPDIGRFRFLEVPGHSVKQANMASAPAPCSLLPPPLLLLLGFQIVAILASTGCSILEVKCSELATQPQIS